MNRISECPNCGGNVLYRTARPVSAGGGHAPNYLPDLGTFWNAEKFDIVVCRSCGLARFFARAEALAKLSESGKWKRA
jgi:predicted RNA-binding Zn-ribbon protein involved in translation (DUF1610 family)